MDCLHLEPVLQEKGWTLIYYNNTLCIKKNNVYYSLTSMYKFKGQPMLEMDPSLQYLGEYIPVIQHNNFFAMLPISVHNNNFFVNQKTNIVYIKPLNIGLMIPNRLPYQFELYTQYTFGGPFHPSMNAAATSGKRFIDMIPKTGIPKQPFIQVSAPIALNHEHVVENTLTQYPTAEQVATIKIKQPVFHITKEPITFLIPFLTYTNNISSLIITLESIIRYVKDYRIVLITNIDSTKIPLEIRRMIYINNHLRYVGKLGIENSLNLKMNNKYDMVSFYNFLVSTYVKTNLYTIWLPHWEIKKWNENIRQNTSIVIPNYYHWEGIRYRSQKYGRTGYVLNKTTKYSSTPDGHDIMVAGMGIKQIDPIISVQANYDKMDVEERKNMLLYGNEVEMKNFFEKIQTGELIEEIEKVIE